MDRPLMHPLALLALATVIALLVFNIIASGFAKIGVPQPVVGLVLASCLAGSLVNIPIWSRHVAVAPGRYGFRGPIVFHRPPVVTAQVVAVNVGGALVPALISVWLLFQAPLIATAAATIVVTLLTHRIAKISPGEGVIMPVMVAPIAAALLAWAFTWNGAAGDAPVVAYVSGSLGTLIGADILNLGRLSDMSEGGILSIGGAGIFDGVFLVGVIAALLA